MYVCVCVYVCMSDVETQLWFEEKLTSMPITEATFLLTTFANMASSRPLSDIHFIDTVTCEIFEVKPKSMPKKKSKQALKPTYVSLNCSF